VDQAWEWTCGTANYQGSYALNGWFYTGINDPTKEFGGEGNIASTPKSPRVFFTFVLAIVPGNRIDVGHDLRKPPAGPWHMRAHAPSWCRTNSRSSGPAGGVR